MGVNYETLLMFISNQNYFSELTLTTRPTISIKTIEIEVIARIRLLIIEYAAYLIFEFYYYFFPK